MKSKNLFLLLLFITCSKFSFSQDTIYLKNGMQVPAIVTEVLPGDIKFKLTGQSDSLSAIMPFDSIVSIKYANGKIELFENKIRNNKLFADSDDPHTMYLRGEEEARLLYKGNGVFWGTFIGASPAPVYVTESLYSIPLTGVGVGVAFSLTSPQKIIVTDPGYLENPDFMRGYIKQAKKKRAGNAVGGFFLGLGVDAVALLIILSSLSFH